MNVLSLTPLALLGLLIAFLAPMLVTMLERRRVWPYTPPHAQIIITDPGAYARATVRDAVESGFVFLGWCQDALGGLRSCAYAILVSHDSHTLMVVGVGAVAHRPVRCTWLYSLSADHREGRITVDQPTGIEVDLLSRWKYRRVLSRGFRSTYRAHLDWVARSMFGLPMTFPAGEELLTLEQLRRDRFNNMADAGFIRFIDQDRQTWKYTPIGAARVTLANYAALLKAILLPSLALRGLDPLATPE